MIKDRKYFMAKIEAPSVSCPFVTERAREFNHKLGKLIDEYQDVEPSWIITMLRCKALLCVKTKMGKI